MTSSVQESQLLFLFGRSKPWLPPPWHTSDDRIRGGSSQSSISVLPSNCAVFEGHLDIETLGGAGFASQFQSAEPNLDRGVTISRGPTWDLRPYDGLEIDLSNGDGKLYTLTLKDEVPGPKRDDGRERAGISWEADFRARENSEPVDSEAKQRQTVWLPWSAFKPTYRGKVKEDSEKLKLGGISRLGLMMRSHFGNQQGDFRQELRSICARLQPGDTIETTERL